MITRAPGWYTDEADSTVERYWNGSKWQDEARAAQGAPTAAATPAPWYVQSGQSSKLSDTGNLLVAVAVLVAVAAVVVGGFLMMHTVSTCDGDFCVPQDGHPFVGSGIGVIAGGLVQALLLLAVGQVARGVHDVRVAVQAR